MALEGVHGRVQVGVQSWDSARLEPALGLEPTQPTMVGCILYEDESIRVEPRAGSRKSRFLESALAQLGEFQLCGDVKGGKGADNTFNTACVCMYAWP